MARKNYVKKTGGFLGRLAGLGVGVGAGVVKGAVKFVQTGDLEKAVEEIDETVHDCIDGGGEIGEDLAPGIIMTLGGAIVNEATKGKKDKKK